jgi:hypothetical protein
MRSRSASAATVTTVAFEAVNIVRAAGGVRPIASAVGDASPEIWRIQTLLDKPVAVEVRGTDQPTCSLADCKIVPVHPNRVDAPTGT